MIALLLAALVTLAQAVAPSKAGIHGRVVDKDTGRPLVRAIVRLTRTAGGTINLTTLSDERGSFAFDGIPPGRYNGFVTARQHALQPFGGGSGVPVSDDQVVEVSVAMSRTYAVDVRVVDDTGEPLSGISIEALAVDTGRTPFASLMFTSDDLGRLRLFNLPPGRYRVCAAGDSIDPSGPAARRDRLVRTCYPSAGDADAEAVQVVHADAEGIEIRMRRSRTFNITGTILDAAGLPAPAAHANVGQVDTAGVGWTTLILDGNAGFVVKNVTPGTYVFQATVGDAGLRFNEHRDAEAFVRVTVADADIDGLVVRLDPAVEVSGKVTLENSSATLPPALGSGLMIDTRLADTGPLAEGNRRYAIAREDRTFTIDNLFGRRVIDVYNVPRGWYLKSIRYGDREIIDTPVTFRGGTGAPSLELVLSDRGAVVNGTVVGEDGTPVPSATVCLLRKGSDGLLSVAATTRGISAGRFTLGPARGGEYVVVALPAASEVMPNAPQDRLQRLAAAGERLTLSDLDERSVQLHVVRER